MRFRPLAASLAAAIAVVLAWLPTGSTALPALPTDSAAAPAAGAALPAALSGSEFRAGNIISDAVFYHAGSMSAGAVQTFLNQRGAACVAGEAPCLKDYRETTRSWPAESGLCRGYTGRANETAAQIVAGVSTSCGINPRVLLVLLEKEQSLVTRTRPTLRSYQTATGFGCPDTAPCNTEYYGFFNQVYRAARQYQVYRANPTRYGYQAGRVNYVRYNPNEACGGSNVYIENQATAGLYIYTPYQPNAAALARLYGTGDGCSTYGNRNFWRLYTDWFGSTAFSVFGAIATAWTNNGGRDGYFGAPTSNEQCRSDGACAQRFQRGTITYRPGAGTTLVIGGLNSAWQREGAQNGYFGFPLGSEQCRSDGACAQRFERGTLTYRPGAGTLYVIGGLNAAWQREGAQNGYFGFPLGSEQCRSDGACAQRFERGTLTYRPGLPTIYVIGALHTAWQSEGAQTGSFGFPLGPERRSGTYALQDFERGSLVFTPQAVVLRVRAEFATAWRANQSRLGFPVANEVQAGTDRSQRFERGSVLVRANGTVVVTVD